MDIPQTFCYNYFMIGLKTIIDNLNITLLNVELFTVGKEWNYRNVNNPYSRIYYITEGKGTIEHHGRKYELLPNNIYLIPCFTTVNMFCSGKFTHYYLHFTTRLHMGLDILSIFQCEYQYALTNEIINRSTFDRLIEVNPNRALNEYDANKPIYRQVLDRAILLDKNKTVSNLLETSAIIKLLLSFFFRNYSDPKALSTFEGLKRFDNVLNYVYENLDTPIAVPQLAKIANLDPTYFSNLFSKLIGTSPLQYINKRRIEKAQELLICTDDTLYEIAVQVGFSDEYYFSRLFKKTVGISPSHYRKHVIHQR